MWIDGLHRLLLSFEAHIMTCVDVCLRIVTVTSLLVMCIPATRWAGFADVPVWHVPSTTVTHVCVGKPFVVVLGIVVSSTSSYISACCWGLTSIPCAVLVES